MLNIPYKVNQSTRRKLSMSPHLDIINITNRNTNTSHMLTMRANNA